MVAMPRYARDERRSLCDTLTSTGPDAATLCAGWTTRDLATHLVVREGRPDVLLGRAVPPLRGHAASVEAGLRSTEWARLVAMVRSGPPVWSPWRIGAVDEALNRVELFVHHEDVRRAQPEWVARDLPDGLQSALWQGLRMTARFSLRRVPVGVELVAAGHGRQRVREGSPVVRVEGPPSELMLFVAGRREQALVDLDGPNAAVDVLRSAAVGL